jgi:hypothetical protein
VSSLRLELKRRTKDFLVKQKDDLVADTKRRIEERRELRKLEREEELRERRKYLEERVKTKVKAKYDRKRKEKGIQ